MISKETKQDVVKKFGKTESDTGSTSVQIALLTTRINELMGHFQKHKKDFHSNRGLLKMIGKRKSLLKYFSKNDSNGYLELIKELGLRK